MLKKFLVFFGLSAIFSLWGWMFVILFGLQAHINFASCAAVGFLVSILFVEIIEHLDNQDK